MKTTIARTTGAWLAFLALAAPAIECLAQTPNLDTKAAFMQIVTNRTVRTNMVVVTNYVIVTNSVVTTNYYNAQGVLLQPVPATPKPNIPGLIPIPQPTPTPAAPDPAVVKANQLQAVRDLLTLGLSASSNKVCAAGSFTGNATQQIKVPQGVTSFDRKKSQALVDAMNLTAEKAAPEAVALLVKSAAQLKTDDPATTIKGDKDAATRLLLATHGEELATQITAIVQRAGVEPKLREAYNSVMLKGGGLLGSVLGSGPSLDIDAHVAQGLLGAIVQHLVAQEGVIRSDAAPRKTAALQEAFKK